MIYYNERGYESIADLMESELDTYSPDIHEAWEEFKEDHPLGITVNKCREGKLVEYTPKVLEEALIQAIPEENWPEDDTQLYEEIIQKIDEFIQYTQKELNQLNVSMPDMWFSTSETERFSLDEIYDEIKDWFN